MSRDPLESFHEAVREWFAETFASATAAQTKGWPPILARRIDAAPRADRLGQDARGVSRGDRPADVLARAAEARRAAASSTSRRSRRSPSTSSATCARRIAGIAAVAARRGRPASPCPRSRCARATRPPSERARLARAPPDILITTPESLYLLLTSRRARRSALGRDGDRRRDPLAGRDQARRAPLPVARAARGAARRARPPAAAHRALGDAAAARGGRAPARRRRASRGGEAPGRRAPSTIVDAGTRARRSTLRVEVPGRGHGPARAAATRCRRARRRGRAPESIWPSIHPRLVELVRAHRSTMIFVNSRRLAERLAAALNETAGEEIALAHHGSVAREKRQEIEERLEARRAAGDRRDLVARARHRHGRGRPRRADRGAALGRVGHAAHRPRGPLASARSRAASSSPSTAAICSRRPRRPRA